MVPLVAMVEMALVSGSPGKGGNFLLCAPHDGLLVSAAMCISPTLLKGSLPCLGAVLLMSALTPPLGICMAIQQ